MCLKLYRTRSIRLRSIHVYRVFGERRDFLVGITKRRGISGTTSPPGPWSSHVPGSTFGADHRERHQKFRYGHVAATHPTLGRFANYRVHARVLQLRPANRMGSRRTSHIDQHHDCEYTYITRARAIIAETFDHVLNRLDIANRLKIWNQTRLTYSWWERRIRMVWACQARCPLWWKPEGRTRLLRNNRWKKLGSVSVPKSSTSKNCLRYRPLRSESYGRYVYIYIYAQCVINTRRRTNDTLLACIIRWWTVPNG